MRVRCGESVLWSVRPTQRPESGQDSIGEAGGVAVLVALLVH